MGRGTGARTPGRVLGRVVTYTVAVGLLVAAALDVEAWPITSFTLFSQPRTERSLKLELVAVDADGRGTAVSFADAAASVPNPAQQLQRLRTVDADERALRARALLGAAGVDPSTVERVELVRVVRLLDSDGGEPTEVSRSVVLEVAL